MVHVLGDEVRHRNFRPTIAIHRLLCRFTPNHKFKVEEELPGVVQHHRRGGVVIGRGGDEVALDCGARGGEWGVGEGEPSAGEEVEEEEAVRGVGEEKVGAGGAKEAVGGRGGGDGTGGAGGDGKE